MPESIALNMDCIEYMKGLPDNAFDLAVVDPPYGDAGGAELMRPLESANRAETTKRSSRSSEDGLPRKELRGGVEQVRRTLRQVQNSPFLDNPSALDGGGVARTGGTWAEKYGKKIIAWDVAPKEEYFEELFRVSRNQIIWGGNYFGLPPTRCFLIWRKTNIPIEGFSMAPCEYAWTSFHENARVFEWKSLRDSTSGGFHPTEKPIALYRWIFQHYAKDGMKILDTHLGSGSSRIAAYDAGLDFVGLEIDKEYFDKQEERFAAHSSQLNLFLDMEVKPHDDP